MANHGTSRLPVPNPVDSFWTADPKKLDNYRSSGGLPSEADIVIIGSGLSGVATAYFLLKDNPNPPSIVLLEARKISSGATGRNGGHVKPDTYSDIPKYAKLFGIKAAAQIADFEASHVYAVKDLVQKEELDCDFHVTRALDVYLDPGHAKSVEATYKKISEEGSVNLTDVTFTPKKDAERVSGVKNAQAVISYTAAHLWPLKLVHALLEKLIQQGLNVQANTPVDSVEESSTASSKWVVKTARGQITTAKVIHATNAYASHLLPEYTRAITPVRGVCSHLASPNGKNTPHLPNTYGIRFDEVNNDYLIPRADGSIIVGGAREAFWHRKNKYYDNIRDDELVREANSYFDNYMQKKFRGWEGAEMEVRKIWTGILGYSFDYMPHVGHVPGKPGQLIIAGFTGYGMPKILLCGKGLAAMVRDGISFEQTGLPTPFKTTTERNQSKSNPLKESLQSLWEEQAKL